MSEATNQTPIIPTAPMTPAEIAAATSLPHAAEREPIATAPTPTPSAPVKPAAPVKVEAKKPEPSTVRDRVTAVLVKKFGNTTETAHVVTAVLRAISG